MINDIQIKQDIFKKWTAIKELCKTFQDRSYNIPGSGYINELRPKEIFNLPFFMSYAVLDEILDILHNQGSYKYDSENEKKVDSAKRKNKKPPIIKLGMKLEASKKILPWIDYKKINGGVKKRNNLAHGAKLLDYTECLSYIGAIERELVEWIIKF